MLRRRIKSQFVLVMFNIIAVGANAVGRQAWSPPLIEEGGFRPISQERNSRMQSRTFLPRMIPLKEVNPRMHDIKSFYAQNDTEISDNFKPITPSSIDANRRIDTAPTYDEYGVENTDSGRFLYEDDFEIGRGKLKKKYKKYLLPLLLAYKLKFFTLIPLMMGGLVLLAGATGLAGFFFALFSATMGLKAGSH